MATVATLGVEVQSTTVPRATAEVDKLTASCTKAEVAAESLGKATIATSGDFAKLDAGIARANTMLDQLSAHAVQTNAQITKLNTGIAAGTSQHIPGFTKALNDNARQVGLTANQMLNLSRQGNDALTMFAMGAAPMQIFASQAGQVYGALQEGPGGVAGALRSVRDGLLGVIRSFPIATGLIAAGAAAWAAYELVVEDVKSLDDILEAHQKNIEGIGDSWEAAKSGAKSYTDESISVFERIFGRTKEDTQERLTQDIEDIMGQVRTELAQQQPFDSPTLPTRLVPFVGLLEQLEDRIITVGKFREEVTKLGDTRPELSDTADRLLEITEAASETAGAAADLEDTNLALIRLHDAISRVKSEPLRDELLKLFEDVKSGDITFKELDETIQKLAVQNPSFSGIIDGLRDLAIEAWNAGEGLRRTLDAASGTPTTMRNRLNRVRLPGSAPIPDARPNAEDILAAQEKAALKADQRDPYQDVIRSADRRIQQLQTEISLLGEFGAASEAIRIHQELLNQATKEGNTLGAEQQRQLKQRAETIATLGEAMKAAKLQQDLLFERDQLGRSDSERAIAQRLRGTGYGLDSPAANFMRDLNRREQAQEDIKGFFTDIRAGLMEGKPIGEALAESILNSFNKVMDRSIDQLFERAANALVNLLFGPGESLGQPVSVLKGAVGGSFGEGITAAGIGAVGSGTTRTGIPLSRVTAAGGRTAQVSSQYAGRFQGLLDDLAAAGYKIDSLGEGGYSYRNVAGTNNLSRHAFGEAIDINPSRNPHSYNFQTDMPSNINDIARANGLTWGGTWNKPDTMHFQVDKTVQSLKVLNEASVSTAANLQGGLGKLGESLSAGIGGSTASTSGGGWLSSLFGFGGAGGASLSPAAWGVVSGGMMTGLFHEGGIAGHAMHSRLADPRIFLGAPRLHGGGIAGDEVPAILKRGERVLSPSESQGYGSGGRMKVEIELVGEGYNIKPSVRRIVNEEGPGIAKAEAVGVVGNYHKQMGKGGQAKQNASYNHLRANTRYG